MKGALLALVSGLASVWFVLLFTTVPVIEKHHMPNDVQYVGGEFSKADVMYVDHREAIKAMEGTSTRWWGSSDGEWRRHETEDYYGRTSTKRVLRDEAHKGSWFGVGRGSEEAKALQAQYDEIVAAYNKQSLFSRVSAWKVGYFH